MKITDQAVFTHSTYVIVLAAVNTIARLMGQHTPALSFLLVAQLAVYAVVLYLATYKRGNDDD